MAYADLPRVYDCPIPFSRSPGSLCICLSLLACLLGGLEVILRLLESLLLLPSDGDVDVADSDLFVLVIVGVFVVLWEFDDASAF